MHEHRHQAKQILSPSNEDRRRQVGFPLELDPRWDHNLKGMGPPDATTAMMEESSRRMQEYRNQARQILSPSNEDRR